LLAKTDCKHFPRFGPTFVVKTLSDLWRLE